MLKRTLTASTAMVMGLIFLSGCQSEDKTETDNGIETPQVAAKTDPVALMKEAIALAKSTEGDGNPAIWLLEDKDTKVYMIGTVHILPDDIEWRTEKFDHIFASVDTLYLETDVSEESQAGAQSMMMEYAMFEDDRTLTGVLGDDADTVAAAFDSIGVPMSSFDGFKPWMGTITLQLMALMKDGYNVESGVEKVLEKEAMARKVLLSLLRNVWQKKRGRRGA